MGAVQFGEILERGKGKLPPFHAETSQLPWASFATMSKHVPPPFLVELLQARSPSGYEYEAQKVFDHYVKPAADKYAKDARAIASRR